MAACRCFPGPSSIGRGRYLFFCILGFRLLSVPFSPCQLTRRIPFLATQVGDSNSRTCYETQACADTPVCSSAQNRNGTALGGGVQAVDVEAHL